HFSALHLLLAISLRILWSLLSFSSLFRVHAHLPSFPTRRSSDLPFPILLAPTAYHKLAHAEGELATARGAGAAGATFVVSTSATDRKSTRLNSSHVKISYAVFCLKKKKHTKIYSKTG